MKNVSSFEFLFWPLCEKLFDTTWVRMETEYLVHVHSVRLPFPLASLMYVTPDPGAPHGGACTGCPFPSACNFVFNLSLSLCAPLQLYFFDTKVNRSYFLCEVQVAHPPVSQVSAALEGRTSSLSSLPAVLGAPLHTRPSPCVRGHPGTFCGQKTHLHQETWAEQLATLTRLDKLMGKLGWPGGRNHFYIYFT